MAKVSKKEMKAQAKAEMEQRANEYYKEQMEATIKEFVFDGEEVKYTTFNEFKYIIVTNKKVIVNHFGVSFVPLNKIDAVEYHYNHITKMDNNAVIVTGNNKYEYMAKTEEEAKEVVKAVMMLI